MAGANARGPAPTDLSLTTSLAAPNYWRLGSWDLGAASLASRFRRSQWEIEIDMQEQKGMQTISGLRGQMGVCRSGRRRGTYAQESHDGSADGLMILACSRFFGWVVAEDGDRDHKQGSSSGGGLTQTQPRPGHKNNKAAQPDVRTYVSSCTRCTSAWAPAHLLEAMKIAPACTTL